MAINYFSKIDVYLDGQLSESDRITFESVIEQDALLKEEVQVHQLERRAIKELLKKRYREKVKTARASTDFSWADLVEEAETPISTAPTRVIPLRPFRRLLSIAASVAIVLVAGTIWWSNTQFSNENLLQEGYYQATSAGNKSGTTIADPIFQGGLQAYFSDKNYTQAIRQFEGLAATSPDFIAAQYYLGHSYLQEKDYPKAITHFETVLTATSLPAFINKDEVTWNQVLAYLGNKDTGTIFQQKLSNLSTNGNPLFQQKAQALMEDLNSVWRKLVF